MGQFVGDCHVQELLQRDTPFLQERSTASCHWAEECLLEKCLAPLDDGECRTVRVATNAAQEGILGWIPTTSQVLLDQRWARQFVLVDPATWRMATVDYPSFIPNGDVRFGLSSDGRTLAMVHATYEGEIWLKGAGDR